MKSITVCLLVITIAIITQSTFAQPQCVKVLTAGDWGTTTFGTELKAWMNRVAGAGESVAGCGVQASALFLLGDNFYEFGVSSTTDSKWTELYENQFNLPNLQAIPEHWATAGNHDHYNILAGTSAQKAYTNDGPASSKWTFPSDYYVKSINQNGVKIFVLFTESWNMVGGDSWLPFQSARRDQAQLEWVEANLASAEAQAADWLIVVGHYPVRTMYNSFGRGDTVGLVQHLEPLMKKYGVDAYIAGHDHFHYIIDNKNLGFPVYYGNGASGKRDKGNIDRNKRGLSFVIEDSLGFHSHVFTKTQMITTIHYKLTDGVERTQSFVQTQNQGPRTPFDCEAISCGATCDRFKEFGCAWSSTANPPKFRGPGGSGTCVLDFGKDTTFWEKNDGVCPKSVLAEAQVLETDEEMFAQILTPAQIAGTVVGTLGVVAGLTIMAVAYRRRSQIKTELGRLSSRISKRLPARLSRRSSPLAAADGAVENSNIVSERMASSDNPMFRVDIKV